MKNSYQDVNKKLTSFKKYLKIVAYRWLKPLKKDLSFYNNHTELLAIWAMLFLILTGLFILAINTNLLDMFLIFVFAIAIMFAGSFITIYYLYAIKLQNKNKLLSRIHAILNKSFKLRDVFHTAKIPRLSFQKNIAENCNLPLNSGQTT